MSPQDTPAQPRPRARRSALRTHTRRLGLAAGLVVVAMLVTSLLPYQVHAGARPKASAQIIGAKAYYLSLGDSLAFGYQPNLDWSHGYAPQWYSNLKAHGATSATYYGCNGETSTTFINGGCPYWYALHNYYLGAQLKAAVSFIKNHAGKVSPVSLDMGANDLLPDINATTCAVSSTWQTDLNRVQTNLDGTILPQLVHALTNSSGQRTGDLVLMNYYDPYQNVCPSSIPYVQALNSVLATEAAKFNLSVADVFTAFGGTAVPNNNICTDTWMCGSSPNIHATTTGYGVIAGAFESAAGY